MPSLFVILEARKQQAAQLLVSNVSCEGHDLPLTRKGGEYLRERWESRPTPQYTIATTLEAQQCLGYFLEPEVRVRGIFREHETRYYPTSDDTQISAKAMRLIP